MKVLFTAAEIKNRALRGERRIFAERDCIITPAARDAAREMGIEIVHTRREHSMPAVSDGKLSEQEVPAPNKPKDEHFVSPANKMGDVSASQELVECIVKKVLAMLGGQSLSSEPVVEKHHSGLRLVRGDTVIYEPFPAGSKNGKAGLKNLLPLADTPNICAGFMTMEKSSFEWELKYDEYAYIIEGELDIVVDGETYRGRAGDVFFIPRGAHIAFNSPGSTKFFYVTYPVC